MTNLPSIVTSTLPALPDAIAARLSEHAHDARGALAANTVRALKADSLVFSAWCAANDRSPLPATAETVAAFIDAMAALDRKPATIRRYVSSIAHMHRAAEAGEPTRHSKVKLALTRAAKAKGTRQRQAAPLGRSVLDAMVSAAGDRLIDLRNRALFAVAYDTLVRRSALVALQLEDVQVTEDGAGTVLVRREKTDQQGEGSIRYLAADSVRHLKAWISVAGITEGALFRAVSRWGVIGESLGAGEIPAILKKFAKAAGVSPDGLSGHSARVGAAQDMVAAGLDVGEVMQAGGWKTPVMVARYSERLLASRGAAAKLAKSQGRA